MDVLQKQTQCPGTLDLAWPLTPWCGCSSSTLDSVTSLSGLYAGLIRRPSSKSCRRKILSRSTHSLLYAVYHSDKQLLVLGSFCFIMVLPALLPVPHREAELAERLSGAALASTWVREIEGIFAYKCYTVSWPWLTCSDASRLSTAHEDTHVGRRLEGNDDKHVARRPEGNLSEVNALTACFGVPYTLS